MSLKEQDLEKIHHSTLEFLEIIGAVEAIPKLIGLITLEKI